MSLVEAESTGPIEGEDAIVTPPVPPHRRVSVSLLFTLTVLVGTVVAIYLTLPERNNLLLETAVEQHREPPATWDLGTPSAPELRAWVLGAAGSDVPLPPPDAIVVGARRLEILHRGAALVRIHLGTDDVTYLVQHARGIVPDHAERVDGDLRAIEWRRGTFAVIAVGPDATSARWRSAFR